jgi:hypothetical protein
MVDRYDYVSLFVSFIDIPVKIVHSLQVAVNAKLRLTGLASLKHGRVGTWCLVMNGR